MIEKSNTAMDLVVENLISIHPLLSKNFTKAIRIKTNHTPGTLFVLGTICRYGKLSMSEIACHLSLPKPHVTPLVEKLIADEMVERFHDTNDRRIIYVQITEKGLKDFKEIKHEIGQELRQKLQMLDEKQLQTLLDASQQVKDILIKILQQQSSPCSNLEKTD